ncbi:MAG: hypothetical protein ACI9NY_000847 [Kiritimatiellia bacterium]|jgi:hypothetical protein
MTASASLILLIAIAAVAMATVAYSNYLVDKKKKISFLLEKMKKRAEELEDVVLILDGICEHRIIPRLINDEIIENYTLMLQISPNTGYLSAGLSNAQMRSNELSDESAFRNTSRICKSDAQIARCNAYLLESLSILKKQNMENKISSQEIKSFSLDIKWLQLQIKVISNIVQGHKAYSKQDILGANAFYKKAQNALVRSSHPDERRTKMINQMADIIFGRRRALSTDLMPETEFNPEVEIKITPEQLAELQAQEAAENQAGNSRRPR